MYSPKIESRAEDWFYHEFHKRTCARIDPQVKVKGDFKNYRLDFVVNNRDQKIAVEIDGKDYHDEDADYIRDKDILKNNTWLKGIVRFDAHDLIFNAPLVTLYFCKFHPEFIFRVNKPDELKHFSDLIKQTDDYWKGNSDRIDSSEFAIKNSIKYLRTLSVYDVDFLDSIDFDGGYKKTGYCVWFMPPEKYNKFQQDQYNYDIGSGEYPVPLEYCNKKYSTVREVINE